MVILDWIFFFYDWRKIRDKIQLAHQHHKTFTFIKNLPETDRTALLRSHNWWVTEKAAQDLYENSGNVIQLERCLRARGAKSKDINELCEALSLADSLKSGDIRVLQDFLK